MFTLTKEFRFEAAHMLPHHDGKCQRLHGHSWKMKLAVQRTDLVFSGPKQGMLVDFGDLSKAVRPLLENYLDHHYLNETLKLENPTSEEIARWIYNYLERIIPDLKGISIEETCTSACLYVP